MGPPLAWMVRVFEPPIYCYHQIVHNRIVVDRFRNQGVVFVDDIDEVPPGSPLMLSAHGSAPDVVRAARDRGGVVIDAVCPLVTKVHHELKVRAAKGYTVLYVGHAGHEEAVGTMAVAPESVHLVEHQEDLDALDDLAGKSVPVALLAQTTLSHDEWRGLMESARRRFPDLWMPNRGDLCFATRRRSRRWPAGPTPSWSSVRPTRRTPSPSRGWPGRRGAPASCGSTRPAICPTTWLASSGSRRARRRRKPWWRRLSPP